MAKMVPLSRGLNAIVDDEDYPRMAAFKWYAFRGRNTLYACRMRKGPAGREMVYMHRTILGISPRDSVDHVNGDGLDNRRVNLRPASRKQNGANASVSLRSTSGLKGVTWHRRGRKWMAQIHPGGKATYLGLFSDPRDAARAYDAAAMRHFGDFSRTNEGMGLL